MSSIFSRKESERRGLGRVSLGDAGAVPAAARRQGSAAGRAVRRGPRLRAAAHGRQVRLGRPHRPATDVRGVGGHDPAHLHPVLRYVGSHSFVSSLCGSGASFDEATPMFGKKVGCGRFW